jgi:site-specific DNA-methyltransferase (adenine-specific)
MEQYINKIINADCLDILKQLPDKCIDLVCTDCPYRIIGGGCATGTYGNLRQDAPSGILFRGCGRCAKKWETSGQLDENYANVKSGKMFDNNEIKFEDWLPEVYRVLKDGTHCYIMVNGRNLAELQKQAEKVGFKYQNLLVWEKGNATPNKFYLNACEFILMLRKGGERWINNMGTKTILKVPNIIGNKCHPTEKPVELMEVLIANSTNENDIVLEPFAGGGSTCIAAKNLKRRFIGIEINEEFCKTANERLEQAQRQQTLF